LPRTLAESFALEIKVAAEKETQRVAASDNARSIRSINLVTRVEAFERGLTDPIALARQQLDELEAIIVNVRRDLGERYDPDQIVDTVAKMKRILLRQPSDSPTNIAARLAKIGTVAGRYTLQRRG
jgi:hypothetical protein